MHNLCCCCFFSRRSDSLHEGLLNEQQELQYNRRNYQISKSYEFEKIKYFHSFEYKNPLTANIYGGWKIHISLDPSNIDNITIAWIEIILPELVSCGVREFKIARENCLHLMAEGAEGQGKLITVYLRHNPELGLNQPNHRNLIGTIIRIEENLMRAQIQPGSRPIIDRVIQGSRYMSFRCDTLLPAAGTLERTEGVIYALPDDQAPAVAAERGAQAYNPFNTQDEYGLYDLMIAPQPTYAVNPI